jgi:response regulator of citrate/malate metabolism
MTFNTLIIDDDISFKKLLERKLRSFIKDMNLTTFDNLNDARVFLLANGATQFDLIILDEHLPDGRGMDLLKEKWFEEMAVLSISSDDAPEIPGALLGAGATYFLPKNSISQPLFEPLVRGVIDRNLLQKQLAKLKIESAVMDTIKTLVSTLKHEINNPLGAVIGAAYLLRNNPGATEDQKQAAELVESSSQRIKHVLEQLARAMEIEPVNKANQKVFHIPGDAPWEKDLGEKDSGEKDSGLKDLGQRNSKK